MNELDPSRILARTTPFQFLSAERRREVRGRLERRTYTQGQALYRLGESSRELFVLAAGRVVLSGAGSPPVRLGTVAPGHVFGELAALFEQPRANTATAQGDVVAYALPSKDFLELVDQEARFSQALADVLRVKQGVFLPYRRLYARILSMIDREQVLLSELLPAYRELQPALHAKLRDEEVDVDALRYAVARLPDGITRDGFYYLAGDLPQLYEDADAKFERVFCEARRRAAWRLLPGKVIMLLRDGISDVTDLLTCMCLYAVEARKIRRRLQDPEHFRALSDPETRDDPKVLDALPFEPHELAGLKRCWPEELGTRLYELVLHHEDVGMVIDVQVERYSGARASSVWVSEIREQAEQLIELDDPNLRVHVVSSNTHSVSNCLSPYLHANRGKILGWGRQHCPHLGTLETWGEATDLLYVTAREYFNAHPEAREEWAEAERSVGHYRLSSTAFTGIKVDLFDLRRLCEDVDPHLQRFTCGPPTLIVNVDYAFGQQAEEILANLLLLFGPRVRSVNVIGKAGGLTGRRGDILLPPSTLLQTHDELYALEATDLPLEEVQALAGHHAVHEGPVLTVAGTLLQDRELLHFYRRIWKCVGLEMEGSFYARELASARAQGVVPADVRSRFGYYVSDVPLNPSTTLSEPLAPWEGVPPLYALTRAILNRIFLQEQEEAQARPPAAGAASAG